MMSRACIALAAALLISGCATRPLQPTLQLTLPPAYAEPGRAGSTGDLTMWWRGFHDPVLDGLIVQALRDNPDIETLASRLREARQQDVVAGARGLPQVQADTNASRTHISEHAIALPPGVGGAVGASSPFGLPGSTFDQFKLGFDASWEIDLFGGARSALDASRARSEAAVWTARDTQVSLSGEVASAYLSLRALQAREAVARSELLRQRETLDIASARAGSGFSSQLEPDQQAAQVDQAAAAADALQALERVQIHALGVLVGQPPENLIPQLTPTGATPAPPSPPPPGLPSDLLRRRPDLRAAERQLAAATADIGVATADLYPKISLTAEPGLVSTSLANLVDWSSRNYSVAAGLVWPLFEGGRLKAQLRQADERQTQAVWAYRKAVLAALKEVEDALGRYDADHARGASLQAAVGATAEARLLAVEQYRAGVVTYLNVLTAQQGLDAGQDQLAQARDAEGQDLVALFKALGGGWSDTDPGKAKP